MASSVFSIRGSLGARKKTSGMIRFEASSHSPPKVWTNVWRSWFHPWVITAS